MAGSVSGLVTFGTQVGPIATSTLDTNFTALTTAVNSANTYSNYLTDSGSANNIVVSVPSPSTATLAAGLTLTIKVAQTNTGPTTLNLNAGGAVGVIDAFGNTLSSNELVGGSIFTFVYNGTKWQIVGGSGAGGSLSTSYADTFTCTAGQTSFTLSANPNGINNLTVSLDGAVLVANIDYTWTGGTTLTLTTGAKVGQTLFVRYLEGFVVANVTATTVTYTQGGTGSTSRTVTAKLQESVSVLDFGADPTGSTDSTTAIANAAALLPTHKIIFPAGTYSYSVSPNWAVQDAQIEAQGEVILKYTGTGSAVILDAGSSGGIYNVTIGRFIVQCPSTAQNAVYVRSVHHSRLGFDVRGAGSTYAGLYVAFAVCTHFDNFTCSVNEGGWYASATPAYGINLNLRNAGEYVSYCLFTNPVIEGPNLGIQLVGALGNTFVGGTSEGCATYGLYNASSASNNKIIGMDFESNTTADVYCQGTNLQIINCDSTNIISFGTTSNRCTLTGGVHQSVLFDTGSTYNSAVNTQFNRAGSGTFTDAGTRSYISNVFNVNGAVRYLTGTATFSPGAISSGATSTVSVTVTGAVVGDVVTASYTTITSGLSISASVTASNTVTVFVTNVTGSPITPSSGTVKAVVTRA